MFSTTSDEFSVILVLHLKTIILENRKYLGKNLTFLKNITISSFCEQPVCRQHQIHAWLLSLFKHSMAQHTDFSQTAVLLASWTCWRLLCFCNTGQKKGNASPLLTSPHYNREKEKKSTYHELLYLYYMQFNSQEKPFKKEEDYLHVAETKKSKSKYEEGYTIRDVTLHSLEILSFYYPSLQRIRQSCSTCEDEQKEKGMKK